MQELPTCILSGLGELFVHLFVAVESGGWGFFCLFVCLFCFVLKGGLEG